MDRAPSAGRWAARALKSFDEFQSNEYDEPRRLLKLSVPADPTPTKTPTAHPADITKMLDTCKGGSSFCDLRDAAMIHCLRSTGMRVGEMQRMQMTDIDFDTGYVTIPKSKNGDMRRTRLDTDALRALRRYRRGVPLARCPYVWAEAMRFGHMRPHSIQKRITARARVAGVDVTPHSFRRGFAMVAFRNGAPQAYVMKLCGWKRNEMPGRYVAQVAEEESLAMHERMFG